MRNQKGFSHILVILVLSIFILLGIGGFIIVSRQESESSEQNKLQGSVNKDEAISSQPKIKNIGVRLDYYDKETGMAGDIKFVKDTFNSGFDLLFFEYGMSIEANSVSESRRNPQPTFIVPLGTKVTSMIDGTVVNVTKLYSNDYSIHVQPKGSELIFELEHVINVSVEKGDSVNAGQKVAEVSDYDAHNYAGLGLYEIGVLIPGNPPKHECIFTYLDESVRTDIETKLVALMKSWEEYRGNDTLYNESASVSPGCATQEDIEG